MDDNCVQCEYFNLQNECDDLKEQLQKAQEVSARNLETAIDLYTKLNKAEADKAEAFKALLKAKEFITNGVEFGYIRMPDPGDTALLVPGIIDKALESLTGQKWEEMSR